MADDLFLTKPEARPRRTSPTPSSPTNVSPSRPSQRSMLNRPSSPAKPGPPIHDGMFLLADNKPPTTSDSRLLNYLRNLFQVARDHKRTRYEAWMRNYRLVNNRLGVSPGASWMPNPRDSEIYPTLSALVAWMTDQHTTADFIPAADPFSDYFQYMVDIADDLSDIVYTTWLTENYDAQIKLHLWDAFQYGTGILKSVWDNSLSHGYGNAMLKRVDPWSFYPDPHATSLDDGNFFIEARRVSYDEIERRWPDKCEQVRAQGDGSISGIDIAPTLFTDTSHPAMANPGPLPSGQARYGQAKATNQQYEPLPGYVIYEFWIRENTPITKTTSLPHSDPPLHTERYTEDSWRVIVLCGNVILMDEYASDLWSYGFHPYSRFCFDDTGEFYGISLVDHLAFPQLYINRLLTAMQHNAELTGNPILVEGANSGTTRTSIFNRPGQRIAVQGAGGLVNNKPEWLQPPSMPAQVMELVNFWISRIENTSGLSAMQKGAMPTQRNAEGTMTAVQEAAFVRIRAALSNLEYELNDATAKLAGLIADNFTEPRIMAILGQDGEMAAKALAAHHFYIPGPDGSAPLRFALQISSGASTPTSRQARVAEATQLYTLGAVDDEYVLSAHQIRHAKQILARLYQKRQAGLIGTPGARQAAGH